MEENEQNEKKWSRRKKDAAPRGVFRHPSGAWAVRFTCGAGCEYPHKRRIGPLKSEAVSAYYELRARATREPGWCPIVEHQRERKRADAERARERSRITFQVYALDFVNWARLHHRSWRKDDSRLSRVLPVLGDKRLDDITTADIDRFLGSLLEGERTVTPATRNRYRDLLSGMFKRAARLGLVAVNPVKGIPKLKESSGRIVYLPQATRTGPRTRKAPCLRRCRPRFGPSSPSRSHRASLVRAGEPAVGRHRHAGRRDSRRTVQERLRSTGADELSRSGRAVELGTQRKHAERPSGGCLRARVPHSRTRLRTGRRACSDATAKKQGRTAPVWRAIRGTATATHSPRGS